MGQQLQIKAGWLQGIRQVPTCRYGSRPQPLEISLIVIHGISLPSGSFGGPYIDALFTHTLDPKAHPYFAGIADLEVSTHLLIRRDGSITQYVSFLDRAWHAGRSAYKGQAECNDYSVGIELEGTDTEAYTKAQYQSLKAVIAALRAEYPDIGSRIAGHCEVAPLRKTDPGPAFDWSWIDRASLP